jgi:hypothetical protein
MLLAMLRAEALLKCPLRLSAAGLVSLIFVGVLESWIGDLPSFLRPLYRYQL